MHIEIPTSLSKNSTIEIATSNGNLVKTQTISQKAFQIPLTQFSKGVYWLKIRNNEYSIVKKIMVWE